MDENTNRAIWPVTTAAIGALIASVVWVMLIPVAGGSACDSLWLRLGGPMALLGAGIAAGAVFGVVTASRPRTQGAVPLVVCVLLTGGALELGHSRATAVLANCSVVASPGVTLLSREVIQNAIDEQDDIGNDGGTLKQKLADIGAKPGAGGGGQPKPAAETPDAHAGVTTAMGQPDSGDDHLDASTPRKGPALDAGDLGCSTCQKSPGFRPKEYKSPEKKNPLDKVAALAIAAACLAATENPLLCAAIGQAFGFAFGDGHDGQSLQDILNSPEFVELTGKSKEQLTQLIRNKAYAECGKLEGADDATRKDCEQLANELSGMVQSGQLYGEDFEKGRSIVERHIKEELVKLCPGRPADDPLCCLKLRLGKEKAQLQQFCKKGGNDDTDAIQAAGTCLLKMSGDQQVLLKTYKNVLCEAAQ